MSRLVHVDEIGHFVGIPPEHLRPTTESHPHRLVLLAGGDAKTTATVDEEAILRSDPMDIVVARDGPEPLDVGALVPVHRRLLAQQIPRLPRIPAGAQEIGRVDVDRVEREAFGHP